ncbi:MAG: hypothetical protein K0R65_721 [Crocinitomicaceae bacterium]|nr:hypothetical protein [Crocinitomicaceae bacterium]
MKTLLGAFLGLVIAFNLQAQCTPGANYADSTFGAWPDTTTNFPSGYANVYYQTDLNFKVPNDAGDIDSTFAGSTISSFSVDSVVGLPPGMSYTCNISSCEYAGGANGCAQISGTSPDAGVHNISIHITANLLIFGFPVPVPYSFEGYRITLEELAGLSEVKANGLKIYPNPVKDILTVSGEQGLRIEIYNSQGQKLQPEQMQGKVNVSGLENGLYFIRVISPAGSKSYSFVKE